MQIIFMGSGSFAVPIVRAIRNSADDKLIAVVTQPDRPRGRGRNVAACPVKEIMAPTGIPILTPEKIGDALTEMQDLRPDLIVVADYGQYIPSRIIAVPPKRAINVHPSLLPKYRGAAPIPWALANGETMTGVTIQYVGKKMDSGDVVLQQEFEIENDETSVDLEKRLAEAGAALLLRALDQIRSGHVHATPQEEAHATFAPKLTKAEGKIDWSQPEEIIRNRIRAFQPWPGTFCTSPQGQLKITKARLEDGRGLPGEILDIAGDGPLVSAGTGALRLLELQLEGRKIVSGAAFVNGSFLKRGDRLS